MKKLTNKDYEEEVIKYTDMLMEAAFKVFEQYPTGIAASDLLAIHGNVCGNVLAKSMFALINPDITPSVNCITAMELTAASANKFYKALVEEDDIFFDQDNIPVL